MLADRFAESPARLGIIGRQFQSAFRHTDAPRAATLMRPSSRPPANLIKALSLDTADETFSRNAVVVEYEFCRIDALVTELFEFVAGRETIHLRRDEQAHALVARLSFRVGLDEQRDA